MSSIKEVEVEVVAEVEVEVVAVADLVEVAVVVVVSIIASSRSSRSSHLHTATCLMRWSPSRQVSQMNCRPPRVASRNRWAARPSRPMSCGPCTRKSTSLSARIGRPRNSAAHRANSSPSAIEGSEAAEAAAATAAAVTAAATRARSAKAGTRRRVASRRRVSETKSRDESILSSRPGLARADGGAPRRGAVLAKFCFICKNWLTCRQRRGGTHASRFTPRAS